MSQIDRMSNSRFIAVRAQSPDDPNGARAVAVSSAYVAVEQIRTFRRLLLPRLGVLAALVVLLYAVSVIPRSGVVVSGVLIAAMSTVVIVWEVRAIHAHNRRLVSFGQRQKN